MEIDLPDQLSPDEERAILKQLGSKPESFCVLYRHYFPRIYAYVAYRVASTQDTEDLTSEIFLKVVEAISRFEYRGSGSFAAWLFRIARNTVTEFYRADSRRYTATLNEIAELPDPKLMPDEAVSKMENFTLLRSAIETLSPRRQEIVTLRFFGGLRNQEIAAVLNLDERTVASHLCRALEDLQQKIQQEEVLDE